MYLIINGNKHTVSKRIYETDTIKYLTVEPKVENVSGVIQMYRDDGFLMCEDNADGYERKTHIGTLLTMTNKPVPVPVEPNFEPTAEELINILVGVE